MAPRKRSLRNLLALLGLGCVAALLGAGVALAGISILSDTATTSGTYISSTSLSYFVYGSLGTGKIPNPVPAEVGTTAAAPLRLATSNTLYTIGPAVAADTAIALTLNETAAAPQNQEIEIQLTVGIGGSPTQTTVKGYVETQHPHTGAYTYYFFYDSGSTTATVILITSVTEVVYACSAIGTCP
jgi:hypothetical protein